MAGLDFLTSEDAQLGLALLAAGGPSATPMSFGQRLAGGMQQAQAQQAAREDRKLKQLLAKAQIDENTSQAQLRAAQVAKLGRDAEFDQGFLGVGGAAPAGGLMGSAPVSAGGTAPAAMAQPAPVAGGGLPPPTPMNVQQLSQQLGIDQRAIMADYRFNGGKGIAEMISKRTTPDMQVSNGYAYDKNRLQPGYLPQLNISNNGQASLVEIGPDGRPAISAPQGAVGTFGAYQGIQDRSRAANTPGRPLILPGGRMGGQSQLSEITGAPPAAMIGPGAGYATEGQMANTVAQGNDPAAASREIAAMRSDLANKKLDPAAQRLMREEIARLEGQQQRYGTPLIGPGAGRAAAVQGGGLEFSPEEKAAQAAHQTRAVDTAKADVSRDTAERTKSKSAGEMITLADRAIDLLKKGPTGSGFGSLVDKAGNWVGQSSYGAEIAAQLDPIAGQLVANVPRMEGPQSDRDVEAYRQQAGQANNRELPPRVRIAALQEVRRLQEKYSALNGGSAPPAPSGSALPAGWTVKVK